MTTRHFIAMTMQTKREALGDAEAARELAKDIAEIPQDEPEDDEQEPDGRWVYAHGCWLYE